MREPSGDQIGWIPPLDVRRRRVPRSRSMIQMSGRRLRRRPRRRAGRRATVAARRYSPSGTAAAIAVAGRPSSRATDARPALVQVRDRAGRVDAQHAGSSIRGPRRTRRRLRAPGPACRSTRRLPGSNGTANMRASAREEQVTGRDEDAAAALEIQQLVRRLRRARRSRGRRGPATMTVNKHVPAVRQHVRQLVEPSPCPSACVSRAGVPPPAGTLPRDPGECLARAEHDRAVGRPGRAREPLAVANLREPRPSIDSFITALSVKKPIHRPSGEKKGAVAAGGVRRSARRRARPSAAGTARATGSAQAAPRRRPTCRRARTRRRFRPCAAAAHRAGSGVANRTSGAGAPAPVQPPRQRGSPASATSGDRERRREQRERAAAHGAPAATARQSVRRAGDDAARARCARRRCRAAAASDP